MSSTTGPAELSPRPVFYFIVAIVGVTLAFWLACSGCASTSVTARVTARMAVEDRRGCVTWQWAEYEGKDCIVWWRDTP